MSLYIPNAIQTIQADYAPQIEPSGDTTPLPLRQDPDGNLMARSLVLTDEGSIRANFANSSISVSVGTITLTNGSNVVSGTNFAQYDLHAGDYIKLDADAESAWGQIDYFESADSAVLVNNYTGTGGTGAGSRAYFKPTTGSGGTISVASGQLTIASGGTASSVSSVKRVMDYSPLVFRDRCSISQRVTNQEIRIGFKDPSSTVKYFARFVASGTTATVISCVTGRNPTGAPSGAETQTTTVTLPRGVTTAVINDYRIEQLVEVCRFYINGVLVASHSSVLPQQYDELEAHIEVENTGAASNTNIIVDYIAVKNHNKLEVGVLSESDSIVANQPSLEIMNFSQAGVITINTDLIIVDCRQLRTVNVQASSIGTTGRLDFLLTNDLSVTGTAQVAYPIGGGAGVTTTTAAGVWNISTNGAAYLRIRLGVATTAGTTTIYATGSQLSVPLPLPATQPVSGTVTATISAAAATIAKAEDAVAASGDTGVFALGVRRDGPTLTTQTSAAGDYSEIAVDNGGAQYMRQRPLTYSRLIADGQVKNAAGNIHTITIAPTGTVTAGVLTVYDSLTETGTVIFSVALPVTTFTPFTVTLNVAALTGIYVGFDATLANVQVTTSYI